MIQTASGRRAVRSAVFALSMLAFFASAGTKAEAQCQLLAAPSKFDPPVSGLPSYFQGRQDSLSIGGTPGNYRLAVRYNYGFLVYSLANPGAPARTSIEDLLGQDRYPKNGDGQERVGRVALSADGTRALQPWTDVAAYGTIAMSYAGGAFSSGGDYLPTGDQMMGVAIARAGTRYLGFSIGAGGTYAADITDYLSDTGPNTKNGIYSEVIRNVGVSSPSGITAVEAAGKSYVVVWSADTLAVIDVSNPGMPGAGLTTNFTSRAYSASQLGIPATNFLLDGVAAARHPSDGALHLLTEGGKYAGSNVASAAVTLNRVDPSTGDLTRVGTYQPPVGARYAQTQVVLLPFDTEVVAFFLEGTDAGGLKLEVHSSADFTQNLAAAIPAFTAPAQAIALAGMRASGGNVYLYLGNRLATYVASVDCSTAPSPATAVLTVEKVPYSGGAATAVADGGAVFIGDQVRIKPAFSPPDAVQPLLDWRLDYDFHDGNPLDSNATTYRLKQPDLHVTAGGTFPTQSTLIGPCDPAQVPQGGSAPVPSAGTGCWESVTTNADWTVPAGTPDFSAAAPADKQLTIGFEVQNALNAGSSSVAKHRISWKVPQQILKSTSILSGGALEDLSEGSPLTTGLNWYVSQVPVGQQGDDILTLQPCTGTTCTPSPALVQPGSYRYWVTVPYRGGFRTAACPDLDANQVTCAGLITKTVTVTDVVLSMTAPIQAYLGTSTLSVTSASKKGTAVTACPAEATAFSYNFCVLSGGSCPEGIYTTSGVTQSNPFPSAGTGTISIPAPGVGAWGLRVRYTYTADGNCAAQKVAQWPASGWSPLTVLQGVPTILLRNSSDTADIPKSLGIYWELTVGQTARVYALLDGVRVPVGSLPSGFAWSRRPAGSGTETAIGTTQGSSFSISTAGEYEIVLRGFGTDVIANAGVSAPSGGGGGGGGVLSVTSIGFSPSSPTSGQSVTVTCNATGGTAPYAYDIVYGDGGTYSGANKSVSHVYATSGGKNVGCAVSDAAGGFTTQYTAYLNVLPGGGGGSCEFLINNAQGARISYDSTTGRYDAASGQPLTFVASGVTSAVNWNFGNGQTATGNPATYTYNVTQASSYTVSMTSGTCSKSYPVDVSAPTGPSFTVVDAVKGTPLASPTGVWEAIAGQSLRFTPSGTSGAVNWEFGDGETSTESIPIKTYGPLVDTTFTVKLTSNGLSRQESIKVKGSTGAPLTGNFTFKYADGSAVSRSAVQPNKAIVFTGADQATTYTWDFGDGSALATGSPREYTFARGGSFTVKLTVARSGVPGTATTLSPLPFTVLAPPDPLLWVAAGMAYADGGNGARWQSDLSIYNPGTQAATVSLAFVAGAGWDGVTNADWRTLGVGPGETRAFSNILAGFFGLAKGAWGVVLVRGDSVPVSPVIVSRTYNAATAEETGTYGLSVPALSVASGVRPQSAAASSFLSDLRHDEAYRTNLTVANLKEEMAEIEVIFRDANGNVLGSPAKITVEARGVKQLNAALSAAPAAGTEPIGGAGWSSPAPHFSAEIKLKRGTGVYPYATVIDQGTGDSIVVTPTLRPAATYRLPGIVRVKGKNGAFWVSDVAILNPSAVARKIRVTYSYVKLGTTRRVEVSDVFSLAPYQLAVAVDFVRFWLGLAEGDQDGYASSFLDFAPASDDPAPMDPIVVTGKTYTPSGTGSVGLQVDAFVFEDGMSEQASRRKLVLSGLEANTRYRTNVALFLTPGSTGSAQVDVRVLDSFGRESKKFAFIGLDPGNPFVQLSSADLFSGLSTDESSRATVVIDSPRGTGYVGAYATVIDNKSEDATFVAGQPAP